MPENAEGVEFLNRLRKIGANDDGEEFSTGAVGNSSRDTSEGSKAERAGF